MSTVLEPVLVRPLTEVHGPIVVDLDTLDGPAIVLRDLMVYPTGPDQTAITLRWKDDRESCVNTSVILENVVTAPGNGYHWQDHIHLTNAWNAQILGCNTIGPAGLPNPVSMNGIVLEGTSTGVTIDRHRASGLATAILIRGECEGTKIRDLDAVGVLNGIVGWPDTGGGEPGLWITDSHINATQWGIHLKHRYQVTLRDVLIYGGDYFDVSRGHPFYGVVLEDCQVVRMDNVKVSRNGVEAVSKPLVALTQHRAESIEGAAVVATH